MKKITMTLIALIVIITGFFSGCNEQNNTSSTDEKKSLGIQNFYKNKFIGTWRLVESYFRYDPFPYEFGNDNDTEKTWIFYENNSLKTITKHFKEYPEEPNASVNIFWTQFSIIGSKIYLPADDVFIYMDFKFFNDYTQFTISFQGYMTQMTQKFIKIE